MAAHQALPSLGFSRQEHWSGLPFPSPMHENEKWKWSHLVVSNSSRPHGLQPARLLCPWDFPGKSTGVGCHCLLRKQLSTCAKRYSNSSKVPNQCRRLCFKLERRSFMNDSKIYVYSFWKLIFLCEYFWDELLYSWKMYYLSFNIQVTN